jgi:hypothetical protein
MDQVTKREKPMTMPHSEQEAIAVTACPANGAYVDT